jgi:hypothetical protein
MEQKYSKGDIVLAALAAANGAEHSPVQIQKILFLIDKKIATDLGGPFFDFIPYDYGPFDRAIYDVLDELASKGFVEVIAYPDLRWRKYRVNLAGQKTGEEILTLLPPKVSDYIARLSEFVRSLSFAQLVSVIYNAYPEMKANSVFRE